MAGKSIEITFFSDGTSKTEAKGFKGKGCAEATEVLLQAIGGADQGNRDTKKTPDFFGTNTACSTITQR